MSATNDVGQDVEDVDEVENVEDVVEGGLADPEASTLSYYGTDFDVAGLVRRLNSGDILIPSFDPDRTPDDATVEGFQRDFVWTKPQQDRFIESLLLGYPIPGIFLVEEPNKVLLVLDGQQRLTTLRNFYDPARRFELENVSDRFRGLGYERLDAEQKRTMDNTFIHATIVRAEPDRDPEAVYQLFERLNTGGTSLQPHEIRVALYNGRLMHWIRELNEIADWRELVGRPRRLKDQELVLRFFALLLNRENYRRPLKQFLNDFSNEHKEMADLDEGEMEKVFRDTVTVIHETWGSRAFRLTRLVNAAVADSLMVAVAERLAYFRDGAVDLGQLETEFETLKADDRYRSAVTRQTSDEEKVKDRIELTSDMITRCVSP